MIVFKFFNKDYFRSPRQYTFQYEHRSIYVCLRHSRHNLIWLEAAIRIFQSTCVGKLGRSQVFRVTKCET